MAQLYVDELEQTPTELDDVVEYLQRAMPDIARALRLFDDDTHNVTHVDPPKTEKGMIRYADGSDWNPGNGEGIYRFDGTSWVRLQDMDEKNVASGYAGLDSNSVLTPSQIPNIGWHLGKNGSDQNDLGTSVELVTWSGSDTNHKATGVTFTDADDSITIIEPGPYLVVPVLRWTGAMNDGDGFTVQILVDDTVVRDVRTRGASSFAENFGYPARLVLAADEVLTIKAANVNSTTRGDIDGDSTFTWFMGQRIG